MPISEKAIFGSTNPEVSNDGIKRFVSVIGLEESKEVSYRELHANAWPAVIDRLKMSNIHNYSIHLGEIDSKKYLFSYFEYSGADFEQDMEYISQDEETQRWWKETDPCQIVLEGVKSGERWKGLEQVFWLK